MKHFFITIFSLIFLQSLFAQTDLQTITDKNLDKGLIQKYDGQWKSQIIIYEFTSDLPNAHRQKFLEAIDVYHRTTNVCFVPKWSEEVTMKVKKSLGSISGSALEATISTDSTEILQSVGQTLGLYYEHQRPDRDNYITINWGNIHRLNHDYFETRSTNSVDYSSPYDYNSIMHLHAYDYSKNGQKTIEAPSGVTLGNTTLSSGDIAVLNQKYPKHIDCDSAFVSRKPLSNFSVAMNNFTCDNRFVTLVNQSLGADEYLWTIEGGTPSTSTEASPTIEFKHSGLYEITLQAKNSTGTHRYQDRIRIEKCNNDITIFPNPTTGKIYMNTGPTHLSLINVKLVTTEGKILYEQKLIDNQGFNHLIQMELPKTIPNGTYFLNITSDDHIEPYNESFKIVLKR